MLRLDWSPRANNRPYEVAATVGAAEGTSGGTTSMNLSSSSKVVRTVSFPDRDSVLAQSISGVRSYNEEEDN